MLKHALNDYESLEQVDFPDQIASGFFQKPKDLSFRMRMCTAAGCLAEVHGWPPLPQYGYLPAFVAKSWGIVLHLIVFLLQKNHQPCITLALSRPFIVTETLPWILAVFEGEQPFAHTIPTRVSVLGAVFACFFSGSSRRRERLISKRFHSKTGSPLKQCRNISRLSVTPRGWACCGYDLLGTHFI